MKKILIISNDPNAVWDMAQSLSEDGILVTRSSTGLDGLLMSARNLYDLILVDENLPDVNSVQLCQKILDQQAAAVAVCGMASPADSRAQSRIPGICGYLEKPVTLGQLSGLVYKINRLLGTEPADRRADNGELQAKDCAAPGSPLVIREDCYVRISG